MSYYATGACQPGWGWWMSKGHRGGGRHAQEYGPGPGGPGFGPGGPGFGPRGGGFGPGGPGFGPRGGGFGPGFERGGPFGGGRGRRRRGDVRLALLMLLAEEPRNGYQLMQIIEERSGGRWRPSPGSVYPALSQLEDEGFVRATAQDSGRSFEITDAGRQHLKERDDETAPWDDGDAAGLHTFQELRSLVFGLGKAAFQVVQVGDEQQRSQAVEVLDHARRSLYRILAADAPDSTDEETGDEPATGPGE